ncbi:hypothetical protein GOC14_06850 [Sinorhizobium meliloti]|nr:hypothetical protein [Sinorhizobium meliloti]
MKALLAAAFAVTLATPVLAEGNYWEEVDRLSGGKAIIDRQAKTDALAESNPERAMCQARWPDDFDMQVYCIEKQIKAGSALTPIINNPTPVQKQALDMCGARWRNDYGGFDWDMVKYCYEKQMTAYERLN